MNRRRWLCLLLALLLALLPACTQRDDRPAPDPLPDEYSVDSDRLFPYYSMAGAYSYSYNSQYGLLNAQGEFVLPMEYEYVAQVDGLYRNGMQDAVALERAWFYAARNSTVSQEEIARAIEEDGWVNVESYNALISPDGVPLTDFVYRAIILAPTGSAQPFVALRADNSFVRLDESGAEHPLDDADLRAVLEEEYRYWINDHQDIMARTGPDIPEYGLEQVIDLPDGSYWGSYGVYENDEDGFVGKGGYENRYEHFTANGERIGDRRYNYMEKLGNDVFVAWIYGSMTEQARRTGAMEEDRGYLTDANGIPLNDQVYDRMIAYGIGDRIAVQQGTELTVLDWNTLQPQASYEVPNGAEVWGSNRYGRPYLNIQGMDVVPRLIFLDEQGGEVSLETMRGFAIDDFNETVDRFLLSPIIDWEKEVGDSYYHVLTDREGNELLRNDNGLYHTRGVLMNTQTLRPDDWQSARYGLYDWDGNQILPAEYRQLNVLDGHVLQVVRGDWTGLIDYAGNWIYRESMFQNLED